MKKFICIIIICVCVLAGAVYASTEVGAVVTHSYLSEESAPDYHQSLEERSDVESGSTPSDDDQKSSNNFFTVLGRFFLIILIAHAVVFVKAAIYIWGDKQREKHNQ